MSKVFDFILNKVIPKKFVVWVIATILVFLGKIQGEGWIVISMVYLGTNVASKFVKDKRKE